MTIGERLLKLRKEKNISQEELANALDVSRQTISKWETDQTTPDFDKIVPLCEYFNITSDELLTGKKSVNSDNKDDENRNVYARNLSIAIIMYIVSVAVLIFAAAVLKSPIIGVCLFFIIIALATGLIIYNSVTNKKQDEETEENTIEKSINNITGIITVIVYLIVSFATNAWHITWIIFLISGLIESIIKLIFNLKGEEKDEK